MHKNVDWEISRSTLVEQGNEVVAFFSIARRIGSVLTLDLIEGEGRRTLYYPADVEEGPHLFDPYVMPFPLVHDGALGDGVSAREIAQGTRPLMRVAQSFDTPDSGAPERSALFNRAGGLLGELHDQTGSVPLHTGLSMFGYIPEGEGLVVFTPPVQLSREKNVDEVTAEVSRQLSKQTFSRDGHDLIDAFVDGLHGKNYGK